MNKPRIKQEEIEAIWKLRREGYSLGEIQKVFPKRSRSTIFRYIKDLILDYHAKETLSAKRGSNTERKEVRIKKAHEDAKKALSGQNREFVIMLAMLYWAEGTKKEFQFINSDGRMIALYLKILRNVVGVSEDRIYPIMRIYSGMNKDVSLDYWSQITGIEKEKFTIRLNDGGLSGKTKYGMCRIEVRKSVNLLHFVLSLVQQVCLENSIMPL